ncbi:TIGR01777 family oxidoreductase [Haliea sp. E1-2-M8]|uniref:TIGR01777 family oxidoreductase n=1 Tax=Haliea sp. E1-2-M8 TaxID=3064706 RepID=UPI00271DE03D|nr:TIGR01777 family oxidoreductase [Haliea sp. E1-2-M8]MDO8861854.1 TIGR01777 family oxidoreductase [Haliea sp. E1-2-M8]
MHILITGGTGFIGQALVPRLLQAGHRISILSRSQHRDTSRCTYLRSLEELPADSGPDAVINLAGASLAGKRWTRAYKEELVASRVQGTRALVDHFADSAQRPRILLSASAIGYYGARGDEPLTEDAAPGSGFASQLCQDWEAEAARAAELGIRTCLLRLGVVLDSQGGALKEMALPFRFGVASWPGTGYQYLSWIHREDVVAAMGFLLEKDDLAGVFNLTAPAPVTQREFCQALQTHFRTLPGMPVPSPVMRLLLGEMAGELLLTGQRVLPEALQRAGFRFRHPAIEDALAAIFDAQAGDRLP